ncbi:MAG: hypothetical protein L0Y74_09620 [candidate division Zixibacteria bacterium]|nr:hypothetical protein [candidate division Zixibacteria bacterium]
MSPPSKNSSGVSDQAVKKATGRDWKDWFAFLDKSGGRKKNHKEIVASLSRYKLNGWWRQMITVAYERARGLRVKYQKPEGFEISVSRAISVPVAESFRYWEDPQLRSKWLGKNGIVIRTSAPHKSMRLTWSDGKTSLSLSFLPKGKEKSQIVVQHGKLPDAGAAEKMKIYWSRKLDRLREVLEN